MFGVADVTRLPISNGRIYMAVCDPPRNLNSNTRVADDKKDTIAYQQFTIDWIKEIDRVMMYESWVIIITDFNNRMMIQNLAQQHLRHRFKQEVIWDYNFGRYTTARWVSSHDNILIYCCGKPMWYPNQIRVVSQRMLSGDKRGNPQGRIPSDVWRIKRVHGTSKDRRHLEENKYDRRSTLPRELCRRLVKGYTSNKISYNEIILDPFSGSGIFGTVAEGLGRRILSFDLAEPYVIEAKKRHEHDHTYGRNM